LRILVVDDEVQVARSIARLLRRHHYEVRTAHAGLEALAQLEGVAIVLTDLRMPGMSGVELALEVKRRAPEVRCCLMSGDGGALNATPCEGIDRASVMSSAIDARLGKPFAHDDLLDVIARLARPRPQGTP